MQIQKYKNHHLGLLEALGADPPLEEADQVPRQQHQVVEDAAVPHGELHRAFVSAEHEGLEAGGGVQVGDELVRGEGGLGRVAVVGRHGHQGGLQLLVGGVPASGGVELKVDLTGRNGQVVWRPDGQVT
jgi:hypothetical protein